jgi:hypothetical protein
VPLGVGERLDRADRPRQRVDGDHLAAEAAQLHQLGERPGVEQGRTEEDQGAGGDARQRPGRQTGCRRTVDARSPEYFATRA